MSNFGKKFTKWVDPKLEKYREPKEPETPPPYVPESLEDFVGVLQRTPSDILSAKDRARISACMSFKDRKVSDVMIPKDDVIFVYEHDFLGPLMLDKLYKSGAAHFPVLSSDGRRVIGVISTEKLNSLEVKNTDRATKYLSHRVYFMREDYSLEQAMAAFLRTNCYFFVVVDKSGLVVGEITYDILVACMIGYVPHDDFHEDNVISSVLKRNMV
ncbi:hypothetical protein IKE07_00205 [Candidatus Saccharibacteria bacterium]|nr:hypothetical protein [Candidatus Saccharibacteria bacterium]